MFTSQTTESVYQTSNDRKYILVKKHYYTSSQNIVDLSCHLHFFERLGGGCGGMSRRFFAGFGEVVG